MVLKVSYSSGNLYCVLEGCGLKSVEEDGVDCLFLSFGLAGFYQILDCCPE